MIDADYKIQFQHGLSLPAYFDRFGTEAQFEAAQELLEVAERF